MDRSARAGSGVSTTSVTSVACSPTGLNSWVCRHGSTADSGRDSSDSCITRTGCQGGASLVIAPGLACQANTSSTLASTTLE